MSTRFPIITRSTALVFAAVLPLRGADTSAPNATASAPPAVVPETNSSQDTSAASPAPAAPTVPDTETPDTELSAPGAPDDGLALPGLAPSDFPDEPPALLPSAEDPPPPPPLASPTAGPSRDFSINLLKRLVERGSLTQKDAEELVLLADADVAAASAPPPTPAPAPLPSEVRVTYVPETVRNRIRDEVKEQLLAEAKTEGWFADTRNPPWVSRVRPFADIRLRYEVDSYPDGNDNTGAFPNFNAINTGAPFDVSGTEFSPQYNVDQERQRARLRFRLGAELDLGDSFTAGFRVGTGQDNSPVSSNQSLGYAGGHQGGNFSKYALWLDRAFLAYQPHENFRASFGRFDNPFFSTTAIWSEDIGFDGLVVEARSTGKEEFQPFITAGAFPVFNTELNFSSNQPAKFESLNKWLYAVQAGADLNLHKDLKAKASLAYYHFHNIEGQLSEPYTPLSPNDAGNTDGTRPAFAQKGNTYRPIRNIVPSVINDFGTKYQYQYFGLATPFEVVTATGRLDFDGWEPIRLSLVGEYAKNLAFDQDDINAVAVNNRGPSGDDGSLGAFDGSDTAWYLNLVAGHAALDQRGQWQGFVGYRWIGSDAVVDGFNDQDFGGGGTNVKGFTVGFNYALTPRVRIGAKWFSADEIAGPAFSSDILMFDLGASF